MHAEEQQLVLAKAGGRAQEQAYVYLAHGTSASNEASVDTPQELMRSSPTTDSLVVVSPAPVLVGKSSCSHFPSH